MQLIRIEAIDNLVLDLEKCAVVSLNAIWDYLKYKFLFIFFISFKYVSLFITKLFHILLDSIFLFYIPQKRIGCPSQCKHPLDLYRKLTSKLKISHHRFPRRHIIIFSTKIYMAFTYHKTFLTNLALKNYVINWYNLYIHCIQKLLRIICPFFCLKNFFLFNYMINIFLSHKCNVIF